jgi:thiopurine S-methyltransferase
MKEDFWHTRWENNQIGFHESEANSQLLKFWKEIEVPEKGHVFVPLCGKSLDLIWLRSQGYQVTGIEISPGAVSDFFKENNLKPKITQRGKLERWEADGIAILLGDFFHLSAADLASCDAVYDRASLIALPIEMRGDYVEHCFKVLPANIPILLVTLQYQQNDMNGPPFSVTPEEVENHYSHQRQITHLHSEEILHLLPGFRKKGLSALAENIFLLT